MHAAILFDEMARRFPNDMAIRLLAIESMLRDRQDVASPRTELEALNPAASDDRNARAGALLKVDILPQRATRTRHASFWDRLWRRLRSTHTAAGQAGLPQVKRWRVRTGANASSSPLAAQHLVAQAQR